MNKDYVVSKYNKMLFVLIREEVLIRATTWLKLEEVA